MNTRSSTMRGRISVAAGALLAATAFLFAGCATTITTTAPDGTITTVKAGFGNRVSVPPITVEPDPATIGAAQTVTLGLADKTPALFATVAAKVAEKQTEKQ